MNTRFLSTFCVVADRGGLSAAARHLGLSSTSLAEQIRALEKDLNARLLFRRGRSITLTEAGNAILPAAREVLGRIDEMGQLAQVGQLQGSLRVGTGSSTMISLLPQALVDMARRHPRIELKVVPGTSPHLYQRVEQGDLDCAIIARPPFELPKTMAWNPVREEPLVLLCAADLAGDTAEELLLAAPFIRMDRNAWTGRRRRRQPAARLGLLGAGRLPHPTADRRRPSL
jgi:DNA-binding transcriptional LysR family regulator